MCYHNHKTIGFYYPTLGLQETIGGSLLYHKNINKLNVFLVKRVGSSWGTLAYKQVWHKIQVSTIHVKSPLVYLTFSKTIFLSVTDKLYSVSRIIYLLDSFKLNRNQNIQLVKEPTTQLFMLELPKKCCQLRTDSFGKSLRSQGINAMTLLLEQTLLGKITTVIAMKPSLPHFH